MASNGNRRVKTETPIAGSIVHRLPWPWYPGKVYPYRLQTVQTLRKQYKHRTRRSKLYGRHKCTASIEYVSLIGVQKEALQVPGVLERFRGINFNGYRHCIYPNTPIEAIRNPARQHQSSDVKVGDNPRARTLRKFFRQLRNEIEEHTIQQGSARVNNGMQQNIGKLATQTSPLS
ncbi:hypothetical protein R3P38DRAFT_2816442 [Favolaschia claudopus]|uniref:Uncharacterized protein n=1 Tax=Favolaschia claudopus TaxID=2862362 RepID=A0AAV9YZD6_9AGAR